MKKFSVIFYIIVPLSTFALAVSEARAEIYPTCDKIKGPFAFDATTSMNGRETFLSGTIHVALKTNLVNGVISETARGSLGRPETIRVGYLEVMPDVAPRGACFGRMTVFVGGYKYVFNLYWNKTLPRTLAFDGVRSPFDGIPFINTEQGIVDESGCMVRGRMEKN